MFQAIVTIVVIISVFLTPSVVSICPTGWTTYGTNCFKFTISTSTTWQQCFDSCAALGASMLCITDAATNSWAFGMAGVSSWIGYTDLPARQGNYAWVAGCVSTYTNWNTGEPNNVGTEDAVHLQGSGTWNNQVPTEGGYRCSCELYGGAVSAVSE